MATLPYTRVVDVNLTRLDNFPARQGFGVPLIASHIVSDVTTAVTAASPIKVYGTIDEVAVDWGVATDAYLMAQTMFAQNPAPLQIKIGFIDATSGATVTAGLDAIEAFDAAWYSLVPTANAAFLDVAANMLALSTWVQSRAKIAFILSTDANTENAANTTCVAAVLSAADHRRTSVYYTDAATNRLHAAAAAYVATRNFDNANSAFTLKFKSFTGITLLDRGSAAVQAITGFTPGVGLADATGHYANAYVDIGGASILVEGTMSDGGFVDEMVFEDWIVARTQEELLGIFTTNDSIPYTDVGINQLAQGVQAVLGRARSAGLVVAFENADGDVVNWSLGVPRIASVAVSQRRQRIAPTITALFQYAGAVHWARVDYTMTF